MRKIALIGAVAVIGLSSTAMAGDAERGAVAYESRCGACHSLDHNRAGPRHHDVYGRTAGSVPGYRYSEALRRSTVVWTENTLDRWLTNPQELIPGQKMGYRLSDAGTRADIIAFLKRESRL